MSFLFLLSRKHKGAGSEQYTPLRHLIYIHEELCFILVSFPFSISFLYCIEYPCVCTPKSLPELGLFVGLRWVVLVGGFLSCLKLHLWYKSFLNICFVMNFADILKVLLFVIIHDMNRQILCILDELLVRVYTEVYFLWNFAPSTIWVYYEWIPRMEFRSLGTSSDLNLIILYSLPKNN